VEGDGYLTSGAVVVDALDQTRDETGLLSRGSGAQPVQGYTIRRGLGRGGFGEAYLAVSDAGKEVALKLVQQHLDVELLGGRHAPAASFLS